MKRLLALITGHAHHYGIPHANSSGRMVMTCYGCSKDKPLRVSLRAGIGEGV